MNRTQRRKAKVNPNKYKNMAGIHGLTCNRKGEWNLCSTSVLHVQDFTDRYIPEPSPDISHPVGKVDDVFQQFGIEKKPTIKDKIIKWIKYRIFKLADACEDYK